MDVMGLLGAGAGLATGGDLVGIGGNLLGNALGLDQLGGSSSSATSQAKEMMDYANDKAMGTWKQSNSNAAGQTGEAARAGFRTAFNQPQQTATAVANANALRDYAKTALSGANQQSQMALDQSNRQARNIKQNLYSSMSGGNPAAVAAAIGKASDSFAGNSQNLLQGSANAYNQALSTAGGMTAQSNDILSKDRALNYETRVKPFENKMESLGSILSPMMSGANAGINAASQAEGRRENFNALGGLTDYLGGTAGTLGIKGMYNGLYGNQKDQPSAGGVINPLKNPYVKDYGQGYMNLSENESQLRY